MRAKNLCGNDLVDLTTSPDKTQNDRFLARVFSPLERLNVRASRSPHITLWSFWAAKEAGFKLLAHLHPDLIFSPVQFAVKQFSEESGVVTFQGTEMSIQWEVQGEWVHCVALPSDGGERVTSGIIRLDENQGEAFFTRDEALSISSKESSQCRLLAKRLLANQGFTSVQIIRPRTANNRFGPPFVTQAGEALDVGISLSHDGNYVAAVISL